MKIASSLKTASGMICAPWLFAAARAANSPWLLRMALGSDPHYVRAETALACEWGSHDVAGQLRIASALAAISKREVASRVKDMLPVSESQLLQDVFCMLALSEKRDGFFVEVGVGDGRHLSNTYMLEKTYGWRGLLVEPNRSFHDSIRRVRSANLDCRAAAARSGLSVDFEEVLGEGEYSRIAGYGGHVDRGTGTARYVVETATLSDILEAHRAPEHIDYISIDTEGNETDVLEGLDFSRYQFDVLTIEHNFDRQRLTKINCLLAQHHYRSVLSGISSFDAWFVHKDVDLSALPGLARRA